MKTFLLAALFISTGSFAQTLDVTAFKSVLTQKKAVLEKVHPGMSKKLVTKYKLETEYGQCDMSVTAEQTVLKVEGDKIIVFSKEAYTSAGGSACTGVEGQTSNVIFFEDKPSLARDLSDLDEVAPTIKSISKAGEIVTMNLIVDMEDGEGGNTTESVTVKYDLSKPSFKNTILMQDSGSTTTGSDMADVDVNKFDLSDILFCESAESDNCSQGNWSDILF